MTARNFAMVESGTVTNLAVVDPDAPTGQVWIAAQQAAGLTVIDLATVTPQPGIGWAYAGGSFAAPIVPTIEVDRSTVPPDGTTVAVVTYTDKTPAAPTQVTFDVNGAITTEPLTSGVASINVASQTPNDTITIACEGLTATVAVGS